MLQCDAMRCSVSQRREDIPSRRARDIQRVLQCVTASGIVLQKRAKALSAYGWGWRWEGFVDEMEAKLLLYE